MKQKLKRLLGLLFACLSSIAIAAGGGGGGGGGTAGVSGGDANYQAGVAAIERQDWPKAIKDFKAALAWDRFNADAQNWLGYAYRNSGNYDLAFKHYEEALRLDPRHKGAHEYVGEAYVIVKNLPMAEQHLAALEQLCGRNCPEYLELDEAIRKAKAGG